MVVPRFVPNLPPTEPKNNLAVFFVTPHNFLGWNSFSFEILHLSSTIMRLLPTLFVFHLIGCRANPYLRVARHIQQVEENINLCFCEGCNSALEETLAGGHSCAKRIAWLQSQRNYTEIDACRRVAVEEYPDECGACNPDSCQVQSFCGVASCTMDVLKTQACDDTRNGCHQCGERIRYLVDSMGLTPIDACARVADEQFPVECGACSVNGATTSISTSVTAPIGALSSTSLTMAPLASPTAIIPAMSLTMAPVAAPSIAPVIPDSVTVSSESVSNVCGTATCTQAVLDTLACDDSKGGCHSCGSRIDFLINQQSYAPSHACEMIGFTQFKTECGGCMPDSFRTPGKCFLVVPKNAMINLLSVVCI